MALYEVYDNEDVKKRLISKRGHKCEGCSARRYGPELAVYIIDPDQYKTPDNLILLDAECAENVRLIKRTLQRKDAQPEWRKWVYGGHRNPLKDGIPPKRIKIPRSPDPYDDRAGEGCLSK